MNSKTIVVLPTYNEAENLPIIIPRILNIAPLVVLVVDDDSPDGTGQVAEIIKEQYDSRIKIIHRIGVPRGLGLAYLDGFYEALEHGAEIIIGMDADLSHSPTQIPHMINLVSKNGYDIVIGSRYVKGGRIEGEWGLQRKFLSLGAQLSARMLLGVKTQDVTSAFRCYSRRALKTLNFGQMRLDGFSFLIEIISQAERRSFKMVEIPIVFRDREHGMSKVNYLLIAKALRCVILMSLNQSRNNVAKN